MDVVTATPETPNRAATPGAMSQYLSFSLAGEEFAVDILHVREIRGIGPVTPLPNGPSHLKGVMNLRGVIVPVIDLRLLLGLPPEEYGRFTVIVVLALGGRIKGFVVDSVCDVITVAPGDVEATSELGMVIDAALVSGIARVGERFVVLLAMDRIDGGERVGP